ncbi:low-density lipoprotein receptor-related protein 1-like [Oppia nitens]|uniref:low-density lipoprotein receptor-related protein 1-like n=1 Tax=Oppia nitens TaxID=1686743 RepID=UPI0023DC4C3C|nr:low-density lipoprotein receptor-related protein 1-like [Oppia nitens]
MSQLSSSYLLFLCLYVLVARGTCCTFDSECTINGVAQRCVNKVCVASNGSVQQVVVVHHLNNSQPLLHQPQPQVVVVHHLNTGLNKCDTHLDCLAKRGIYSKCRHHKCVKSHRKICVTDNDCKQNRLHKKCKKNQCKFGCLLLAPVVVYGIPCTVDAECTINGIVYRCQNGQCALTNWSSSSGPIRECYDDINCYTRGIYYKCRDNRCVPADHKLCLSDNDCKKNWLNRRCLANHCSK